MNQEETSKTSIGKIDKVEQVRDFHNSTGGKWIPILKSFNPFGAIGEAYAETLAYKIETKRLEVELTRIEKQAEVIDTTIDRSFKLKMEELKQRRLSLFGFYQTVNVELQRRHIEREKVLEMAQSAQQKSFENDLSSEDRRMYQEMAIEMTKQVPRFGDQSNETLQKLVSALPPVEISPKLLDA